MEEKITLTVSYENHTDVVLTNSNGDTYTSKSEELMDFLLSSENKNVNVNPTITDKQIKEQEFRQASINRYGNDPNLFGAQRDGFIEGAKWMQEQEKWIPIITKKDLPKERCYCWFFDKPSNKVMIGEFLNERETINFILANASHYMVFNQPELPKQS